mmetsp:Transcript_7830/g.13515  ORF Transcript_7830/g.13515 Transcript_7830/m.13515 type:complete len:329 (-) Transcript_7830:187-1173(-)
MRYTGRRKQHSLLALIVLLLHANERIIGCIGFLSTPPSAFRAFELRKQQQQQHSLIQPLYLSPVTQGEPDSLMASFDDDNAGNKKEDEDEDDDRTDIDMDNDNSLNQNQEASLTASSTATSTSTSAAVVGFSDVGDYDKAEQLPGGKKRKQVNVGDPQEKPKEKDVTVTSILLELAAIQQKGPQSYCIIGTRHCSYLHQQIIEMLAYALVLSGNHVYTSGAGGTHAATIRGALRAEDHQELLTVVLPQSLSKQPSESQQLLEKVENLVIEMPQNDDKTLDVASRICNSYLVNQTDQMIAFAFHESSTVLEATREAREQNKPVTTLFLD